MARLILVPQFPTKLRYQEWWWVEFPYHLAKFFDEIIVLGKRVKLNSLYSGNGNLFAPTTLAVRFEMSQIEEYLNLKVKEDDVLLLNDISYPGLFANVLFHKKPNKCYAICHATSKNYFDYFQGVRKSKYPVEKGIAKLFDKVIVATAYHKDKLNWPNISILPLPEPPRNLTHAPQNLRKVVSVARKGRQRLISNYLML